MKRMIWHPEPKDEKVNQYLDRTNREPWLAILAGVLILVCFFYTSGFVRCFLKADFKIAKGQIWELNLHHYLIPRAFK